jgi:hypothetical protein
MLDGDMGLVGRSQETLFYLRPKGWLRLDELQTKEVRSSQAFVAMWFNETTEEPYLNGLYKAIYDSGYDPRRVDQKHHHLNKVDDEIIAEIRRSLSGCRLHASRPVLQWASIFRSFGRAKTHR